MDFDYFGIEVVERNDGTIEIAGDNGYLFFSTVGEIGDRIRVKFFNTVYREDKKYSQGKIVDANGKDIDSAFPIGEKQAVTFETRLSEIDGKVGLYIGFLNILGEKYLISNVEITNELKLPENLFGGKTTFYQFEQNQYQSMGFCFITENKKLIMIDSGASPDAKSVYEFIKENGGVVDYWFITHYHEDHVGALCRILDDSDSQIKIKNLFYNFPKPEEICGRGDADDIYVEKLNDLTKKRVDIIENVNRNISKGEEFKVDDLKIKVLNDAYFGEKHNFVNDSSVVYKVETKGESVLFFGDLADRGNVLLNDEYFLKEMKTCSVVQTAHHGQDGVSDSVYKAFNEIKVCLYCAAHWLYNVDNGGGVGSGPWKTLHTRRLMRSLGVTRNVTSEYGRVELK